MRAWMWGATGAMIALVAPAPIALAASEAVCAIDFDLRTQGLMLRYSGTELAFDTQDDAEGIRVLVDFDRPVAVRAGQSLSACAEFASWRVEGARLVIAFKRPYTLMVQDDPQARVAWLFNASAHRVHPVAAATPTPTPAPVVAPARPAAAPVPMAIAASLPGRPTRPDTVPGRKPRTDVPVVDEPPPVVVTPALETVPVPEAVPAEPTPVVVAGRPPVATLPPAPIAPPTSLPVALPVALPVVVPVVTPAAPAVTQPPAGPWWMVAPRREGVAIAPTLSVAGYAEQYPAGDVSVQTTGVLVPGVTLAARGRLPFGAGLPAGLQDDWFTRLRVDTAHYAFRDTLFPLSTHTRQTWRADWQAGRTFSWQQLDFNAGLGYQVRWETTLHSAVAPEPSYAFASGRLLQGPELTGGLTWRLPAPDASANPWLSAAFSGWGIVADGGLSPLVMSRVDGGAGPLPGLMGTRWWVGAERWVGDRCVRFGYQRTSLTGGGQYDETFQGPTFSVQ